MQVWLENGISLGNLPEGEVVLYYIILQLYG